MNLRSILCLAALLISLTPVHSKTLMTQNRKYDLTLKKGSEFTRSVSADARILNRLNQPQTQCSLNLYSHQYFWNVTNVDELIGLVETKIENQYVLRKDLTAPAIAKMRVEPFAYCARFADSVGNDTPDCLEYEEPYAFTSRLQLEARSETGATGFIFCSKYVTAKADLDWTTQEVEEILNQQVKLKVSSCSTSECLCFENRNLECLFRCIPTQRPGSETFVCEWE